MRSNSLGGISAAAMNVSIDSGNPPHCAGIHLSSDADLPSTGVVFEQNAFECPANGQQNTSGYSLGPCRECFVRP